MATKNLKVLMSGDTKPYRQEVDKAAKATATLKGDISGQLNDLAKMFGANLGSIGASSQKISLVFKGLTASFASAAAGGSAFTTASTALAVATNTAAQAEARLIAANAALTIAQGTAGASAEALAAAEAEVTAATLAASAAQNGLATAKKAVAAASAIGVKAMKIFKVALASTGIGLVVIALGALIAYFSSTREGAAKIKIVMAEVGAVVRTLIDRFSSLGEAIFKFFSLDFVGSWKALKATFTGLGTALVNNASAAGEYAKQLQAVNKQERENKVIQQQRLTRAAELRADAKEEGVSAQAKHKMLKEASDLYKQYYEEEKSIAAKRRDILVGQSKEFKLMGDELNDLEDAKVKVLEVDQSAAEAQKALSREMKGASKEINAQAEATNKLLKEKQALDNKYLTNSALKPIIQDVKLNVPKELSDEQKKKIAERQEQDEKDFAANIKKSQDQSDERWRKEMGNISNVKSATVDLSGSINNALNDMGVGVGEFLGNLLNGEGGVQSFGTMVAGVFADMAIQVGKIAIATGIATDAIQKALKGHPYLAIAAGIALVAIGTAVKGRLASVAAGGGSGSVGSGGGQNFNFDTRSNTTASTQQKVIVEVVGTLEASAKGMAATLSSENTRVKLAT